MPTILRLALCASALATILASAHAEGAFLTKAEIEKQVIGKSFSSTTEKGKPMVATFTAKELRLLIEGKFKATAAISWKGDVICLTVDGKAECDKVRKSDAGYEFVDATSGKTHNVYKPQ